MRFNELPNQSEARNAINFDLFARNPFHIHLTVAKNM
jgi:hypothetical protein